jgi:hypothetical protein
MGTSFIPNRFSYTNFQYARYETRNPTNQIYGKPDLWGRARKYLC